MTSASVMKTLKDRGSERTQATYARHGMSFERTYGVSVADLKVVAKQIKGRQELAMELYATEVMEAMYLAGLVANGAVMTREQLQAWAEGSGGMSMISEYAVPWVTVESAHAVNLAHAWIGTKVEHVAASGWCTHSGRVATKADPELDMGELKRLMQQVIQQISTAANRERYTMNNFVIAVGTYVQPLRDEAIAVAEMIGDVAVDVGDTACRIPSAAALLGKLAANAPAKKRKTIHC